MAQIYFHKFPYPLLQFLLTALSKIMLASFLLNAIALASEQNNTVNISTNVPYLTVNHHGTMVKIHRTQDVNNKLADDFTKTSRPCPPFCIHPMQAAEGVQTIGEIEILNFMKNEVESGEGLLVDARLPKFYESETIPTAVNIPFVVFTHPSPKRKRILELLGAVQKESGAYDFSGAIKLCLFCNGPWCDSSPRAIQGLVDVGYPPEKLAYYRGGMQLWKLFGLTTVLSKSYSVERE